MGFVMPLPRPVIVVPGITATHLRDFYTLPPDTIWSVVDHDYERAALHPDDLRWEAHEPAQVAPDQIFEVAYKELVEELRHNLTLRSDRPVPVYPFGYDWRHPLPRIVDELEVFVQGVIERTKLLRHYHRDGYAENPKVDLVGHSMGGLLILGLLARAGGTAPVGRVATLATPFRGSFEAVVKISTGTANLGSGAPSSREREAARVTPALYYLMPCIESGLQVPPGLPPSLYAPEVWQPSVIDTIAEYIRLHGRDATDRRGQARALFERLLTEACDHRRRLAEVRLEQVGLRPEDWLCIVGVDAKTRVRLRIEVERKVPGFAFHPEDRQNLWESEDSAERRLTGDGTVPYEGAVPHFLDEDRLVCVTPSDFGYWEIADKAALRLGGFHGILPNMNLVHRLIVRHFAGQPDRHGNTWGRPAPGVADWRPPLDGLADRSQMV
jgi:pimeloyl-ACP methyl ester carboxylesterase